MQKQSKARHTHVSRCIVRCEYKRFGKKTRAHTVCDGRCICVAVPWVLAALSQPTWANNVSAMNVEKSSWAKVKTRCLVYVCMGVRLYLCLCVYAIVHLYLCCCAECCSPKPRADKSHCALCQFRMSNVNKMCFSTMLLLHAYINFLLHICAYWCVWETRQRQQ